jgi:hypothetical protein
LNATAQHRGSLPALEDRENIMKAIRANETMIQRWRLYAKENEYAREIEFGEIMDVLKRLAG